MKRLFLLVFLAFAKMSPASWSVSGSAGFTPVAFGLTPVGITENFVGGLVSGRVSYFLDAQWGIFSGLEWINRGTPLLGSQVAQVSAIEIPFGLTVREESVFGWNAFKADWSYGLCLSFPLSDLKTAAGDTIQTTQPAIAGFFGITALRPLVDGIVWGPSAWIRVSLSQAYLESEFGRLTHNFEIGLALTLAFGKSSV